MYKLLLLLFCSLVVCPAAMAGDFPYGNFSLTELQLKHYEKDKTAHAVVLQEFGKTWVSTGDGLPLIHEYHVKIKIFDSKGFDEGNVSIPIYKSDNNSFDRVRDIEGVTTYTDEQGSVQRTTFDRKNLIIENKHKYLDVAKFAMPNLRNGCVIEYKYTLESPRTLSFKNWEFQSDIPKISSEYEVHIPAVFAFKITLRGPKKLDRNNSELESECFQVRSVKCDCSKFTFDMTAPKNFISALYFDLEEWMDPYSGQKHVETKTWDDIDRSLKSHEEFGVQLRKTGVFKDKLPAMLAGETTELGKAKAIYTYIQKNIKYNNYIGIWSDNGLRKTLDTHTGSVADINLALITALNAAGLNAEAVLLSTRDHGVINKLYPVVREFNYVVAKVNIGDKSYMLDATDALLPFGLLPEHCLNDQGRVVSLNKPSYWVDMVSAQKKTLTYAMNLTLQPDGKLTGNMVHYSNGYEALEKRRRIKKFNTSEEYVENLDERMTKMKIRKWEIKNLDSLDLPLVESYDVEFNLYDNLNASRLAFNPYMLDRMVENPFKLADRTYPVDWGAASDRRVILTVHLPAQYEVETPPVSKSVGLPNKGGSFITAYEANGDTFTFSHIIQFNHPIYTSEEYPYLKELFNNIIQAQKADIIFKKK
jgi:hypothetical protein